MNRRKWMGALLLTSAAATSPAQQAPAASSSRKSILIQVTQGPENPTRAALAFLVARTAIEEGHSVTLFLAGDAVQLMRDEVLDQLTGLGTGKLRDSFDGIVRGGGRFHLSANSSKARGVGETHVKGKPVEFSPPTVLVRLVLECDRVLTY